MCRHRAHGITEGAFFSSPSLSQGHSVIQGGQTLGVQLYLWRDWWSGESRAGSGLAPVGGSPWSAGAQKVRGGVASMMPARGHWGGGAGRTRQPGV